MYNASVLLVEDYPDLPHRTGPLFPEDLEDLQFARGRILGFRPCHVLPLPEIYR